MRVALIGNMNNNNFSIMRYFRDLGVDAHLLLFWNDGKGCMKHFKPECDTWDIERWRPYIHQMKLSNDIGTVIENPEWKSYISRPLFIAKNIARLILGGAWRPGNPASVEQIKDELGGYDVFIGAGLSPAIMHRIGRRLDIFYPYAIGIEFFGDLQFLNSISYKSKHIEQSYLKVRQMQKAGIANSRYCLNAESGQTKEMFDQIGVDCIPMAIPMVYNRECHNGAVITGELEKLRLEIKSYDLSLVMHSRLLWVKQQNYTDDQWQQTSKHNNKFLESFASFIAKRPNLNVCLYIVEYGPDVRATKKLCANLGIQSKVKWLPVMMRKEILRLLSWCDIGVGEFYLRKHTIWGGTGWEVLSVGKPLLQGFNFDNGEFEAIYNCPEPPMLKIRSHNEIQDCLIEISDNPQKRRRLGVDAKAWFDRYNGIGLAKQWIDLFARA